MSDFAVAFRALTGNAPFPWQQALYEKLLAGTFPEACSLPTGMGKTSVMAIWLLALAERARTKTLGGFPRRLAYVVNRRTVVDQATAEAEEYRRALSESGELHAVTDSLRGMALPDSSSPLAISTLRGEFADNGEWCTDPARAAIVIGTVDMIGSRLLFSGYGCGFKRKPLHAGFLGQDTLLLHDEAHLEPAFQALVAAIVVEQARCRGRQPLADARPFRVMALTATPRDAEGAFKLSAADEAEPEVHARLRASKTLRLHAVPSDGDVADEVARLALAHEPANQAVLVYLRRVDDVRRVADHLGRRVASRVQTLTGTLRGLERDRLVTEDRVFARFRREPPLSAVEGTVYLVCTSAGEVGVNISADHLVSDLTPFDSMAQRFGRVNRFGGGHAQLDVVHPSAFDDEKPLLRACHRTLEALRALPAMGDGQDASPAALGALPAHLREAGFTPQPAILPLTEILLDAWSLTSIRGPLPGRPPVAEWLHGVAEWEPPRTTVAWREDVERLTPEILALHAPEDLLDDYPLKPHETLSDDARRVATQLLRLSERNPARPAWVLDASGTVQLTMLRDLVERDRQGKPDLDSLAGVTVLLPPNAGGLAAGQLDGGSDLANDVADAVQTAEGLPIRRRAESREGPAPPEGMRLVRTIEIPLPDDEEDRPLYWHWYVRPRWADDDGSRAARAPQELAPHLRSAAEFAHALVVPVRLALPEREARAVVVGAGGHDLGKRRAVWQRAIRNRDYPQVVLAKSGGRVGFLDVDRYRHEFGSLADVAVVPEFLSLDEAGREMALHVIAAHHGRARPHFPEDEAFDPEGPDHRSSRIANEVLRRFSRLQRTYGRWGLAYLESLLRASDARASQSPPEFAS